MSRQTYRVALWATTFAYFGVSLVIGFWSTAVDRPVSGAIRSGLILLHSLGVPYWFNYAIIEFASNIWFFVPIGALLAALVREYSELFGRSRLWRWCLPIVGGALFSACLELGQLLFLPGRFASWGDILANSTGTALGVLALTIVRSSLRARRDTDGAPRPPRPERSPSR